MNIGFATDALLKELQKKGVTTEKQVWNFMEEARTFFVATLKKLTEKSSLVSSFVCYTAIFDPTILALE